MCLWAWFVIVKSFLLSPWWFTKPTRISVLLPSTSAVISDKSSSYLKRKTKKNKTTKCPSVFFTPHTSTHTIHWTSLWANLPLSAFHCSHIFLFVCHSLFLDDAFFLNRSLAMQIPCRHSNLVCQRPSLNPSFWVNIPCCYTFMPT